MIKHFGEWTCWAVALGASAFFTELPVHCLAMFIGGLIYGKWGADLLRLWEREHR